MYKIVFVDFDGTLFSHKTHHIPSSTIEAVHKLRLKGIKVFICTGRALREMSDFDMDGLEYDGFISLNSQVIYDGEGQIIHANPIKGELKDRIIELLEERNVPICLSTANEYYINFINEAVTSVQENISSSLPEVKEYQGEDFFLATIFVSPEEEDKISCLKDVSEIARWNIGGVDVTPIGANKKVGVDMTLKMLDITKEEALCFGDGENDIPMFEACGTSVCMNNGMDKAKEKADIICEDIDDDGLYKTCVRLELIN